MPDDPTPDPPAEQQLRAGLAALAQTAPLDRARWADLDDRIGRQRAQLTRRRQVLAGAAASVAVAAGGGLTYAVARSDSAASPDPQVRTTAPTTSRPLDEGTWHRIEPAPLSARQNAAIVWAGDRLIVWGGDPYVVGPNQFEPRDHLTDGASWDPTTERWTPMSAFDEDLGLASGAPLAVWTGSRAVLGPVEPADYSVRVNSFYLPKLLAFDPVDDSQRLVPLSSASPAGAPSHQAVVLGPDWIVTAVRAALPGPEGHEGDLVGIDPRTGEHQALPPGPFATSPYPDDSGEVTLTAMGGRVVATTNWDFRPWVLLDLGGWTWLQAPAPDEGERIGLRPPGLRGTVYGRLQATSIGAELLYLGDTAALAFDPVRSEWRRLAPDLFRSPRWSYPPTWTGRELLVPGAAYDPEADRWRVVAPPSRGADRQRDGIQSAWTGDALLLFGGEEYTCPDNATCDRSRGPDTLDGWLLRIP